MSFSLSLLITADFLDFFLYRASLSWRYQTEVRAHSRAHTHIVRPRERAHTQSGGVDLMKFPSKLRTQFSSMPLFSKWWILCAVSLPYFVLPGSCRRTRAGKIKKSSFSGTVITLTFPFASTVKRVILSESLSQESHA